MLPDGSIRVTRQNQKCWHLSRGTDNSVDAELHGLAKALYLAVREDRTDWRGTTVRVFTDCTSLLMSLKRGTYRELGPRMDFEEPLAIELLYDRAEQLLALGAYVESC